jgi:hypothetical protein
VLKAIDDRVLRALIQYQVNPRSPRWGIDSNRDVEQQLKSNKVFKGFIDLLKSQQIEIERGTTDIQVNIYDPKFANPNRSEQLRGSTIDNFRVLMIHGYDSKQPGGCVYGPYYVSEKNTIDLRRPARMSVDDIKYVTEIRNRLDWKPYQLPYYNYEITRERLDENGIITLAGYPFLYLDLAHNAKKYEGDWSWYFTDNGIWAADIELLIPTYDEGIRGNGYSRLYDDPMAIIDKVEDILPQFTNLLSDFPWKVT